MAHRSTMVCFVALVMLGVFCEGHNWLHSSSRAANIASTTLPCRARKASDLHAQVGPGQEWAFNWATGHNKDTYVVLLRGDNEDKLSASDLTDILDDYIANAPPGSQLTEAKYRRYHQTYADDTHYAGSSLYSRKLESTDPLFIEHPRNKAPPSGSVYSLWEYDTEATVDDQRVEYESETYPWILSVHRFPHLEHVPKDSDIILLRMPSYAGPGHHVVHWRWNGYTDCTDVDYRESAVALPYGDSSGTSFVFSKVDHCQYIEPKAIETQCYEAPVSIDECITRLPGSGQGQTTKRFGVNAVPLKNPAEVPAAWRNNVNIPFYDEQCVSDQTRVTGDVSMSGTNWNTWRDRTTFTEARMCSSSSGSQTSTLRQAIIDCSASSCFGIYWDRDETGQTGINLPTNGVFTFHFCSSAALTSTGAATMVAAIKDIPAMTSASGSPIQINFVGTGTTVTDGAGWMEENGELYADRSTSPRYGFLTPITGGGGRFSPYTVQSTWLWDTFPETEANGVHPLWEIDVPNGVYTFSSFHDRANPGSLPVDGCMVEGMRLSDVDIDSPVTFNHEVEVADGKLTIQFGDTYDFRRLCRFMTSFTAQLVGTAYPPAWIPAANGPWIQMDMLEEYEVSLVVIPNLPHSHCGSRWAFQGDFCKDGVDTMGYFGAADTGLVVSVADEGCSGSNCPGGTVCEHRQYAYEDGGDIHISCRPGVRGRYVRVQFPGTRIVPVETIHVYHQNPDTHEDMVYCYGVEARLQTETEPEYVVSHDPEDPIFYSTCWVREPDVVFLPTGDVEPRPTYRYNGETVDCRDFHANLALPAGSTTVPRWHVAETDVDCSAVTPPPDTSFTHVDVGDGQRCADKTCADGTVCSKQLQLATRANLEDAECMWLVERDPECTSYFWTQYGDCYCWRDTECCGVGCNAHNIAQAEIWRINPPAADPTCATGHLSVDGTLCCAANTCFRGADDLCGESNCQWSSDDDATGFCCSDHINLPCLEYGPPCVMP